MFTPESHVSVTLLGKDLLTALGRDQKIDNFWRLEKPLVYEGRTETFEVPAGFETDFASVPRVLVWLIPKTGRYTRASILHDWLWSQAREGKMPWRDADGLFRRAMRDDQVAFVHRWIIWAAVRLGSLWNFAKGGAKGWWRDAPIVLLLLVLIGLVVAATPVVVIAIALTIYVIYEGIVWVVLAAGRAVKREFGREPKKKLVPPHVSLTT